ncbi:excinuclease ABC subunit UvrC [Actinomyces sp. 186855]|uniref:excinuclease ABC subunit UvrC n=1 Tax=Actinomyces sp. 186855 TaxID=2761164 RepID=UPI002016E1BB|nr:excinuclease ABC subunit UvrC [Actinomyces sp. 186855]MCL3791573.1 excinuclease ABC subunit UvrC [Actinomyces sp. 186855]
MADPSTYRPAPGEVPTSPGVYRFIDAEGRVIYVGKAKNLRQRLSSYFQDLAALHPRTQKMVTTACAVEWTVVSTEVESLALEYSWIKEFNPRFNVMYKDDKSYPYLAVTMQETYPRAMVVRGARKPGTRYFGPYVQVWSIRETLDQLLRVFPVRSCSPGVFKRAHASGRPCLLGYIDKCSAPCVGRVSAPDHRRLAEDLCAFMAGRTGPYLRELESEMRAAAAALDFERAARLRDDVAALTKVIEQNAVVLDDATDADVFSLARDELTAAVQVFHVRGAKVDLRVPRRGDKAALMDTVRKNAEEALRLHRTRRAGDLTQRAQALEELAEALDLPEAPLRVECYDISHTQGTYQVGSMVVFEDGAPRKSYYRRFTVRGSEGRGASDDTAAMSEVLTRRFTRLLAEQGAELSEAERELVGEEGDGVAIASGPVDPATGRARRFSYAPGLVVVDGGLPQVNAARAVLDGLGLDTPLIGLAKRLEEVWVPGEEFPVVLPRTSPALYLLQHLRDESHRFAITHHRSKRAKGMTRSVLDSVPGLGPARQAALLKEFGSVKRLRQASPEQVAAVKGIGPVLATAVLAHLSSAGTGDEGQAGPGSPKDATPRDLSAR